MYYPIPLKLRAWLENNNIPHEVDDHKGYITIMLEEGCTWINKLGEPMKYDRTVSIHKEYGGWQVYITTGYMAGYYIGKGLTIAGVIRIVEAIMEDEKDGTEEV